MDSVEFWQKFFWPLLRLLAGMACGLLLASFLESLRWTDKLAKFALPITRFAHMSQITASAFSLAFISPAGANAFLSEKFGAKKIDRRELMLANLFNGLPAFFSHAPTLFLLTWPAIGWAALWYTGLSFLAAIMRALITIFLGRCFLPSPNNTEKLSITHEKAESFSARLRMAPANAWRRFRKRIPKLVLYTAPVYALMFLAQRYGVFPIVQQWLSEHLSWLTILQPQAMGIIAMQLVAEMGAALGAASAALTDGSLDQYEIILAMLVGNVLATPLRTIRHQLPAYAGFYSPALALRLVLANQCLRAFSMIIVICLWVLFAS